MPGIPSTAQVFRLLAFLFAVPLWGTLVEPARGSEMVPDGMKFRHEVEQETFALVNQYRQARDLLPLVWDEAIAREARGHSRDMATHEVDFGHEGFGDRVDRLKAVMGGFRGAGENVLMTDNLHQVAGRAVAMWLHSPHHLENIRGDYNYSAIGVWQDAGGAIYFTQIFMKIQTAAEETGDAPPSGVMTPFGLLADPRTRSGP